MSRKTNQPVDDPPRLVPNYGTAREPAPFPWWVFIAPVSLTALWLRVWGVLPFPFAGRSWYRDVDAFVTWAFFGAFISVVAYLVERTRLGERWALPRWAILVFSGGILLSMATFPILLIAAASTHPK